MSQNTDQSPSAQPARVRRRLIAAVCLLALAGALAAVAAASSSGTSLTVKSAANSTLGKTIAVNSAGRTLYSLSAETAHHILCKNSECTSNWPPLTVANKHVKLHDGSGVHGTLGLVRRANGRYQVMLRGKPLYRFAGDEKAGQDNGEGIKDFGATWHAVAASVGSTTVPPPTTTPTTPTTPSYPY